MSLTEPDEFVEEGQFKTTGWHAWHDTLQDAVDHVRGRIKKKIRYYEYLFETEKKNLEDFNLKYPL